MNINFNFAQLINSQLNDMLLNSIPGNSQVDRVGRALIKFANKYGFFGAQALDFVMELTTVLSEASKEDKDE